MQLQIDHQVINVWLKDIEFLKKPIGCLSNIPAEYVEQYNKYFKFFKDNYRLPLEYRSKV